MPVTGDIVECRICCYTATQIGLNVTHWGVGLHTGAGVTLAEFAQGVDALVFAAYPPLLTNSASYRGVGARGIWPLPVTLESAYVANNAAGTAGTAPAPAQISGLLALRDGLAGQRHRGRMYIPFPDLSDVSATTIPTAGYQTRLNTLAASLTGAFLITGAGGTATIQMAIYHRDTHTVNGVNAIIGRAAFATQRSRGVYGRPNTLPF